MNGYITVQDAAKKWEISERQVQILCKSGRIDGAQKLSRIWIIPEKAEKPTKSADIRINKIIEGKGKYAGVAGSIETNWGNVSSFKEQPDMGDIEFRRKIFLNQKDYIGKIIQVEYRELTEDRKLRFPSLVRIRDDKDYEDIEVC